MAAEVKRSYYRLDGMPATEAVKEVLSALRHVRDQVKADQDFLLNLSLSFFESTARYASKASLNVFGPNASLAVMEDVVETFRTFFDIVRTYSLQDGSTLRGLSDFSRLPPFQVFLSVIIPAVEAFSSRFPQWSDVEKSAKQVFAEFFEDSEDVATYLLHRTEDERTLFYASQPASDQPLVIVQTVTAKQGVLLCTPYVSTWVPYETKTVRRLKHCKSIGSNEMNQFQLSLFQNSL